MDMDSSSASEGENENALVKDRWDDDDVPNFANVKSKPATDEQKHVKFAQPPVAPAATTAATTVATAATETTAAADPLAEDTIDLYEPVTKEQFDRFESLIKEKLTKYDKSAHYVTMLDELLKELCQNLQMEDVKKISNTLTAVSSEKLKQSKTSKVKKKGKRAALTTGKDVDAVDYDYDNDYDAYEDYL
ncbi:hypothetical protein HELRODRAFT_194695 [Helobdella robusta]|uniref:Uncharacterized protein n=1 Tax=Helobdella robusta TaxID=6412 RepID=T1FWB9_HELRO|nr:hypothetical protein HELRODRAFT_194695 [Helobdella robusta]ESN90079.1 hypothetical protein HELRODRAFT_194695 [Helobdella robusta]